jgi:hypothetical protein
LNRKVGALAKKELERYTDKDLVKREATLLLAFAEHSYTPLRREGQVSPFFLAPHVKTLPFLYLSNYPLTLEARKGGGGAPSS